MAIKGIPETRKEMLRAGYKFLNPGTCKGCSAAIEWWRTTHNRTIPFNVAASEFDEMTTHWATCPEAKSFKEGGVQPPAPRPARPAPAPPKSAEHAVIRLRESLNARVVVLIGDDGPVACWRTGLDAEDLRHDLISAANFVRNTIRSKGDTTL